MKLLAVNFMLLLGLVGISCSTQNLPAQADITFRNATAEDIYPKYVIFRVEICGLPAASQVLFNYTMSQSGIWEKETRTLDYGQTPDGCYKQTYFLETRNFYVPPFSQIKYFWSVTGGTNVISQSSNYAHTYKNEGYTWRSLGNEQLVIWWHDRPDSFGQDVMSVATLAYNDQAKFYAFSLESPITIVITNTSEEFFAWQPRKNSMSGVAFAEFFLTVQLVEDNADYNGWLNSVIPHEISHIYFGHLVKKDSGASQWLNEGLASYNEYSDHWGKWITLKAAYDTGKIPALKELEDDFGEDPENIELAYAESYYAVLYMNEVYGRDAIATLLNEYSQGIGATVAFEKSFGKDPESFENDFMAWLGERLKTPPPNTNLPQFILQGADVVVYFFAGVLCLGGLFVTAAGIICIVIFLRLGNNHVEKTSETKAHS